MIIINTTYGIKLTDNFGRFYNVFKEIKDYVEENESVLDIIEYCPSAEDNQYVIGIQININKDINIVKIHEDWLNYYDSLPCEFKQLIEKIEKKYIVPDINIQAGKC